MGFVHNMASLLAVRFMLGLAEAGLFPGEQQLRRQYQHQLTTARCKLLSFLLVQKV